MGADMTASYSALEADIAQQREFQLHGYRNFLLLPEPAIGTGRDPYCMPYEVHQLFRDRLISA